MSRNQMENASQCFFSLDRFCFLAHIGRKYCPSLATLSQPRARQRPRPSQSDDARARARIRIPSNRPPFKPRVTRLSVLVFAYHWFFSKFQTMQLLYASHWIEKLHSRNRLHSKRKLDKKPRASTSGEDISTCQHNHRRQAACTSSEQKQSCEKHL